jgi:hypothetical protein
VAGTSAERQGIVAAKNSMPLTLPSVLGGLGQQVSPYLARQQTTPGRFDTGAVIRPDWGVDDPGGSAGLVALSLWMHLVRRQFPDLVGPEPDDPTLLRRTLSALEYLERAQRPSGLTDLRDCNYDSSPDAGFILQAILPPLHLARNVPPSGTWREAVARLSAFARKMTEGARTGGFHTPNHRWVIVGALHLAQDLFPEIDVAPTIAAYLAEGIDIDEEGFYSERSAGVYDAICARSLFLVANRPGLPCDLSRTVERNLLANTYLLNADGTIETGLSRRQDAGTAAPLAANLAVPYVTAHFHARSDQNKALFLHIGQWLWDRTPPDRRDYYGMSQILLAHGEPEGLDTSPLPSLPPCVKHFPKAGLWRQRRGPLSVSVFRDQPRLLHLRHGAACVASVSVHQSYFGVGQFLGDEMEANGEQGQEQVRLVSHGLRNPAPAGYEQPLGCPVAPEQWQETRALREVRRVAPATGELTVEPADGGVLRVRYQTLNGLDRVTHAGCPGLSSRGCLGGQATPVLRPAPGRTIFLKQGYGTMRYGNDSIRIGPGADAHRMTPMPRLHSGPRRD